MMVSLAAMAAASVNNRTWCLDANQERFDRDLDTSWARSDRDLDMGLVWCFDRDFDTAPDQS